MDALPVELWSTIIRHVKREPPAPGKPANWNDDLNQQDLVSCLLVNKDMYRFATSVLYKEIVVQDVGLLLMGILEPLPILAGDATDCNAETDNSDTDQSVPYHKTVLLDKIEKVHIAMASSRIPVEEPFMVAPEGYPEKVAICAADRLGTLDLDGWLLTGRLSDPAALRSIGHADGISFARLGVLTTGMWDDGRWTKYHDESYSMGDDRNKAAASPLPELETIRNRIFSPAPNMHPVDMCYNAGYDGTTSQSDLKVPLDHLKGLTTMHAFGPFRRSFEDLLGRTRVFYTVDDHVSDDELVDDGAQRQMILWYKYSMLHNKFPPDTESRLKGEKNDFENARLQLCLVPDTAGDKDQLEATHRLKDKLEKEHLKWAETEDSAKRWLGKTQILSGDDVPACPCCGLSR